ncbi:hypothetical protein F4778DRAFT_742189 [Xylariomycetidae sp. FL2044]|nr:hypothetical protein F4778DRAFT_742189 [Xylariomycetidae sp. FL2044]
MGKRLLSTTGMYTLQGYQRLTPRKSLLYAFHIRIRISSQSLWNNPSDTAYSILPLLFIQFSLFCLFDSPSSAYSVIPYYPRPFTLTFTTPQAYIPRTELDDIRREHDQQVEAIEAERDTVEAYRQLFNLLVAEGHLVAGDEFLYGNDGLPVFHEGFKHTPQTLSRWDLQTVQPVDSDQVDSDEVDEEQRQMKLREYKPFLYCVLASVEPVSTPLVDLKAQLVEELMEEATTHLTFGQRFLQLDIDDIGGHFESINSKLVQAITQLVTRVTSITDSFNELILSLDGSVFLSEQSIANIERELLGVYDAAVYIKAVGGVDIPTMLILLREPRHRIQF